ncbi:uncharacterized protein LAESUDRAFT_765078 [Laetiporus sulphureus 93-53]|uniref:Uncharacterized protein n=1 Tax=Laetiporus sulphureus 93-53 TaxID=1314785 RepID=A0A165AZ60_9APHY|nr:uncharacterized protein LAESUDRAFT_765078 [Laetiporus sulphureus 93-53]KZS99929.1 hypothetical protein LAESUDRAFT_765078 [Laetiporus sulphureus 93-53]
MPQHQPYGTVQEPLPGNAQWGRGMNGYPSSSDSATRSAAESLAYLQGATAGQSNSWQRPAVTSPHPLPQSNGGVYVDRGYSSTPHAGQSPMNGTPQYPYPS